MKTQIAYKKETSKTVQQTLETLTEALKQRSFGILSTINVSKIIKEKTGNTIDDYLILDVCNPKDANNALSLHKEVGLALPCKIIIYKDKDKTVISLFRPTESIKTLGFSDLKELAQDVEHHLEEAINAAV